MIALPFFFNLSWTPPLFFQPEPLFVGLYICNYLVNCKATEMSTDISITFLQSNQNLVAKYLLNYLVGKVLW